MTWSGSDLLNPLESVPLAILAIEFATTISLARRRLRQRLLIVFGFYLTMVAAALAFGLIGRDEFGFSFIPLLVLTAPWQPLHLRLPASVVTSDTAQIVLGVVLNCTLVFLVDRLSYPNHDTNVPGRHATK